MSSQGPPTGTITVTVPARRDFVAVIRVAARSAAALGDLAIDHLDDVQMAVEEALTLLLPLAMPDAELAAEFVIDPGRLRVVVSVDAAPSDSIDRGGLAWMMLTGLDPDVEVHREDGRVRIVLERDADDQIVG